MKWFGPEFVVDVSDALNFCQAAGRCHIVDKAWSGSTPHLSVSLTSADVTFNMSRPRASEKLDTVVYLVLHLEKVKPDVKRAAIVGDIQGRYTRGQCIRLPAERSALA